MRAVANYVHKRPATAADIMENATFATGKPIRASRITMTTRNLVGILSGHKDFFIESRNNEKSEATWGVEPKSKLLTSLDRKDRADVAAKKEKLGEAEYKRQIKILRGYRATYTEKNGGS